MFFRTFQKLLTYKQWERLNVRSFPGIVKFVNILLVYYKKLPGLTESDFSD